VYIDKNFAKELQLDSMAEIFHISPNYFSSLFHLSVGKSFMEYVIDHRIEKAKQLLGQEDARSSEIAEKVGYDNPYYFSRIFKKYTGLTPSEYRDSLKNSTVN
jgi:two-component system response regulator YesN